MVVVISCAPGAKVRVVVPDGLKAGEGIGEYADPFMFSNVVRAVCMATSSARMMVRVSSVHVASMNMVVEVGISTNAAPSLG